jgi:hypothetical protein
LIPVTGLDMNMGFLGRSMPGVLFGLSFSFAGLGTVMVSNSRQRYLISSKRSPVDSLQSDGFPPQPASHVVQPEPPKRKKLYPWLNE